MEKNYKIIFEALLSVLIIIQLLLLVLISIGFIVGINLNSVSNFGVWDLIISILILFDFIYFRVINGDYQNSSGFIRTNWIYMVSIVPLFFICFNLLNLYNFKIIIGLIGLIRIYALLKVLFITSRDIRNYSDKTKLDLCNLCAVVSTCCWVTSIFLS
jgi:voltage-gated potassium channel